MSSIYLPTVKNTNSGFLYYLHQIQKFPLLTPEEEYAYGVKLTETGDKEIAKIFIQSHLRLVVKIASKFSNYGLPMVDLVSEGNIGLLQAVKKFDIKKGFRFATYSMWWIKAYIQEFILKFWSLVKIGTTASQKKLFFNLRKIKKRIGIFHDSCLSSDKVKTISANLNVTEKEVVEMNERLNNHDTSLNQIVSEDSNKEAIENLVSDATMQDKIVIEKQRKKKLIDLLNKTSSFLNEREIYILKNRILSYNPLSLKDLSIKFNISKERVRQIEVNIVEKLKKNVQI